MDKKEYVIQKKSRNKQEEEVETPNLNLNLFNQNSTVFFTSVCIINFMVNKPMQDAIFLPSKKQHNLHQNCCSQ